MMWQLFGALLTAAVVVWGVSHFADWLIRPKGVIALRMIRFCKTMLILLPFVIFWLALMVGTAVGILWLMSH